MSDYITLLGAEQVQQAGSAMREAGNQMERAASNISGAMDRFERLVERFEMACDSSSGKNTAIEPGTFMEIRPITRRHWQWKWPWWATRVAGHRYFVNGIECDITGKPLPIISGDDLR